MKQSLKIYMGLTHIVFLGRVYPSNGLTKVEEGGGGILSRKNMNYLEFSI